ncbi:MAG: S-methyl-5-thioribose-1-phosphate isomerase [Candidatus Omnitrophica bacterium]|nr:S-methyl-5-thioribose-1-phosphate isomerase [Candidatus Omnitrophota bacterium]
MKVNGRPYQTVWLDGSTVKLIEQRKLPHVFEVASYATHHETARAIQEMVVRGAGAIGAAAGYAMAQAALHAPEARFHDALDKAAGVIRATRPTAHDLFYAVDRVCRAASCANSVESARMAAVRAATALAQDNARACQAMGRAGLPLMTPGLRMLTHCNAGWLAFVDWGSALAPVYAAQEAGIEVFVYATETRPRSQGAKLTEWELAQADVPHQLIADTAAGSLFQRGEIGLVIVGADRIAANGDTANKIGTYTLAVLARRHNVPFYVAASRSTFDLATPDGSAIPIEQRSEDEVLYVWGRADDGSLQRVRIAGPDARALNPAFDVTPAELIRGFITDQGILPATPDAVAAYMREPEASPAA